MEFTVTFECDSFLSSSSKVVEKPYTDTIGLAGLDFARRYLNNPELPASKLAGEIKGLHIPSYRVVITEDTARKIHHFQGNKASNNVYVTVPAKSLSPYTTIGVQNADGDGDLQLYWSLDIDAILHDWMTAGGPLKWDPEKTEKSLEELLQVSPPVELKVVRKKRKNIGALFITDDGVTAVYAGPDGVVEQIVFKTETEVREYLQGVEI
jgi:hypothetical protein